MLFEKGLDLSKIQSIPVIDKPWEYAFFMDAEFKNYDTFQEAMKLSQLNFGKVKIFGKYMSRKQ
jgi:prephenate dehydratase